jgi:hypothetical protein
VKASLRLHKDDKMGGIMVNGVQVDLHAWRKVLDTDGVAEWEFEITHDAAWQALLDEITGRGVKVAG